MERVFKALADPTRRELLDALFRQDGQTLVSLTARFDMTRIAVAKHLGVLEEAGLVVTKRQGREKFHFLNVVPIRMIHDRWIDKYRERWSAGLIGLRDELEATMEKVYEIYIRTTPERLWHAITSPETRARFQFGCRIDSDWAGGSSYEITHPNTPDRVLGDGTNIEVDPPRKLVQAFHAHWDDASEAHGPSRVTWEIEPVGDSCRLVVTHDELAADAPETLYGGWPMMLSGLKTYLETGTTLTTPGSLAYAAPRMEQP
ncbi:MAG TPA: metalloregulator ArsR/SmtB family transcription factor [Acidimicrobiales bacterium]|nr:metalloregulator ArsR/SmtB family transcription factor [Acidimicrobiales bacterium]